MIGIHVVSELDGKTVVCWFPFPKTLEQGDQLVKRLEREAKAAYDAPDKPCFGGYWHDLERLSELKWEPIRRWGVFKYKGRVIGKAITDSQACGKHHLVEVKIT